MTGRLLKVVFWYLEEQLGQEVTDILKSGGYSPEVRSFTDLHQLEDGLRSEAPDIFITDFDLPGQLTGKAFSLCRQYIPDVHIILLAGDRSEEKAARALSDEVWDYVLKSRLKRIVSSVHTSLRYSKILRTSKASERSKVQQELISQALISGLDDALLVLNEKQLLLFANKRARDLLDIGSGDSSPDHLNLEKKVFNEAGEPCSGLKDLPAKLEKTGSIKQLVRIKKEGDFVLNGLMSVRQVRNESLDGPVYLVSIRDSGQIFAAEEAVSKYRSSYKAIFDTLSDGILILGLNPFSVTDYNPRILEMFEASPEEIGKMGLANLLSEEEGFTAELLLSYLDMEPGSNPAEFEWLCASLKGRRFWVSVSVNMIEHNGMPRLAMLIRDIDEQKQMEAAIRKSQQEFMNLAENSPDVIMRFDRSHRHLYVNHSIQVQLGLSPDIFMMKTHQEMGIFPEHLCRFWEENMDKVFTSGIINTCEFEIDTELRKVVYEWRLIPEEVNDRGEVETIVAVARDVTENRQVIERINESKRMLYLVMDNIPQAIFWKDINLCYIGGNRTFCNIAGIKNPEDLVGKSDEDLNWDADQISVLREKQMEVLKSGEPLLQQHFTLRFGADRELSLISNIVPLHDAAGSVIGILGTNEDITLRTEAERALMESEDRLQLALQATSMGLWDWNLVTDDIYYSPVYFSMLGYGYNELPHTTATWRDLLHPEEREEVTARIKQSLEEGDGVFNIDFRMRRKNGEYAWVRGKGRLVEKDEHGKPYRLVGTHEDISDRKRQEIIQQVIFDVSNAVNTTLSLEALYEEIRGFLGNIVDTTNCFLALYNQENNTLSLPFLRDEKDSFSEFPAGKTLTGYVIKTGKSQLVDAAREEELMHMGEIELVGTPCVSWLGVPLKIEERIIGVFVIQSYQEDIVFSEEDVHLLEFASEQIALAIERKRDQDNIRKNQEKQRRIFESSPDAMIVVDLTGRINDFNTSFIEIFKVERDIALNENLFNFFFPNDRKKAFTDFERTWAEGYLKNIEYRMMRGDGTSFEAEISTGAIFDNNGDPESMLFIMKNIDQRKNTERSLRDAKEKAEEADRLKTAFLSNMSHEIRTPMNAIIGFADLLSDPDASQEDKMEYIAQINYGADNLMHLIDDIIDISKIEAGQISVHFAECNIYDLFQELRVMNSQTLIRLDKSNLRLRLNWDWPSEQLILRTDPFRLKQVLINLMSNAIKFTDEGHVDLGIEKVDGMVRIYVRDTGIGIAREKHEIIFDRFRQGHESKTRLYGGTGLGLAISKNLIELLGGRIGLHSTPGEGSEFWILLPLDEVKKSSIKQEEQRVARNPRLAGKKILVAEDDYSNFYFIKEALKYEDIELVWARDGQEAIDFFHEMKDIDIVLMDIQMPVIDGYECTRIMKKEKPDIPVIAQTAYAMAGERQLSRDAGCDNHLSKPIKVSELLQVLQLHLK
ncbi:MAG: PAS domain S-box protein [Bacteroidota bacterium]